MRWILAMTKRSLALIVAFALVACRGQDQAKRSTPNYEVVSEGSASGVTSTINGPGEKPAPVTDTNVDTTTNFTLPNNPNPLGNESAGTSIAGTLPSYPASASTAPVRRASQPRTDTNGMASSSAPIVIDTIGITPPMSKETRTQPRSDSDGDTTTASSDTATTTSTAPATTSSAPKKKTNVGKKPEDQSPPPPPSTDTTGTQG
jgi:hypothetical protein